MSYKRLFSRALGAAPERLHFSAHSHHLWPDASYAGHMQAWEDAARFADHKWEERVFCEVVPTAQGHVAGELGLPDPRTVAFAPSTHELVVRILSAREARCLRVLTTDGEFHSFRRQSARWAESGRVKLDIVALAPAEDFAERFLAVARAGRHDVIYVSQVFFKTGFVFTRLAELAALAKAGGPWLIIDGYHGFMAVPNDLSSFAERAFYLAGGYKYAMSGEGAAFAHAPPGFAARPEITGWFAEFGDLEETAGKVGYAADGSRLWGATFDVTGLYRFNAVRAMLSEEGLDTRAICAHVGPLLAQLARTIGEGAAGPLGEAEIINAPRAGAQGARFLALRHKRARKWCSALAARGVVTDSRDDILRIGVGLYHDAEDVERFCAAAAQLSTSSQSE